MHFYADKELNQIRTVCFIHLSFVHNYLNKMNYLELSYLKKKTLLFFSYNWQSFSHWNYPPQLKARKLVNIYETMDFRL